MIVTGLKSYGTAYLLWFVGGAFGLHKFYLDKPGQGFLWMFTLGFLGVGVVIDLFTIPSQVDEANRLRCNEVYRRNSSYGVYPDAG